MTGWSSLPGMLINIVFAAPLGMPCPQRVRSGIARADSCIWSDCGMGAVFGGGSRSLALFKPLFGVEDLFTWRHARWL